MSAHIVDSGSNRPLATVVSVGEDTKMVMTVEGVMGIGRAVVMRLHAHWPARVILRLQLWGLEKLRVDNGVSAFIWAVSPGAGERARRSVTENGVRKTSQRSSADFSNVKLLAVKPPIALVDGYFEVALPAAIFSDNPTAVLIHWIDF